MHPRHDIRTIWALAWPNIMVFLLNTVVSLSIVKMAGSLGTAEVAALTTGTRIFFIMQAIMTGICTGASALIARSWGASNRSDATTYTQLAILLSAGIGLLLSVIFIVFAADIARFYKLDGDAAHAAITYLSWFNLFNIFFSVLIVISTALRAVGDSKTPMYVAFATNSLYFLLSLWFCFGGFNLPAMGVKGLALGAGIAYSLGSIYLISRWQLGRLAIPFKSLFKLPDNATQHIKQLSKVAIPSISEQIVVQLALLIFLWLVSDYGEEAFAAYGVGLSILSVTMVVGFGFTIAGSVLVGQALGAKRVDEATKIANNTFLLSLITMTFLGVLVLVFAQELASFIVNDPEVIRLSVVFLVMLAIVQPLLAIEFAYGGALRGAGDTRFPLISTFCGFFGGRIPLAIIFSYAELSVEWIYGALIGDYIIKACLLVWRFRSKRWLHAYTPPTDRVATDGGNST